MKNESLRTKKVTQDSFSEFPNFEGFRTRKLVVYTRTGPENFLPHGQLEHVVSALNFCLTQAGRYRCRVGPLHFPPLHS